MPAVPPIKLLSGALFTAALVLLALIAPSPGSQPAAMAAGDVIPGRYIVVLEEGRDPDGYARLLGHRHGFVAGVVYRHALHGFAADLSDRTARALRDDPNVRFLEPDRIAAALDQDLPTGVDRINGDRNATADIDGNDEELDIDIAVIDTGADLDHPDLRVVGGARFHGFPCGDGSGSFDDDNGHGSHVSGTAAARDNDFGVVGVAPSARIWAVKVLGALGFGSTSCVIKGVDWVTEHADTIDVANMSLGGLNSDALCAAIADSVDAGVTYVVAAGNESRNANKGSPANCDSVITVSAVADYDGKPGGFGHPTCSNRGPDDTLATFSNFGAVVDIAAPGVCILSTWRGGGYNTISGTSMASPHVAGAAALHLLDNPGATPAQVRAALILRARPQGSFCGFTGDPDLFFHERFLWVGPLLPCLLLARASPTPALAP